MEKTEKQCTLRGKIFCDGIGLHSAKKVHLVMAPADANSGIFFVRTDLKAQPIIHAVAKNVTTTIRSTTLEENNTKVFTVEHLLSALSACGIDNCRIELDAEEPPVMHGNSIDFFHMIKKVGFQKQVAEKKVIRIEKVYRIDGEDGKKFVMAIPCDNFRVSFISINPNPVVGIQYGDFEITEEIYEKEIANARTIAAEKEIESLRAMGLGLGGTLENVIVFNDEGWINELNYPDEFVRHKILDIIGDIRLAGVLRCHIIAMSSGHALNSELAKKIYTDFSK